MIPASERLYDAIVQKRLVHPDDPRLDAHVHVAVAKHSRRGWRLDKVPRLRDAHAEWEPMRSIHANRRGTTSQRGYGAAHQRRTARAIAAQRRRKRCDSTRIPRWRAIRESRRHDFVPALS